MNKVFSLGGRGGENSTGLDNQIFRSTSHTPNNSGSFRSKNNNRSRADCSGDAELPTLMYACNPRFVEGKYWSRQEIANLKGWLHIVIKIM